MRRWRSVVGQAGDEAVGVRDLRRLAVRVVRVVGRDVAERVGDRVELAALEARGAGVIGVGRDVGDVRARAVFGQHPAEALYV